MVYRHEIQIARPVNLIAYHARSNYFESKMAVYKSIQNSILRYWLACYNEKKKKKTWKGKAVSVHIAVTHSLAHSLIGTRNIRHPFLAKIALLRGKEVVSRALYRGCSSRVNRDSLEVFPAVDRTSILDSRLAWFTLRNLWNAWWKKSKLRSVEKKRGTRFNESLTILVVNLYRRNREIFCS